MKNFLFFTIILSVIIFSACSKDDSERATDTKPTPVGKILYDRGEQIYSLDLRSGAKSIYFEQNNYLLNSWDVSWDERTRLETSSIAGDFQNIEFRFVNPSNGTIEHQITYPRSAGEDRTTSGRLVGDRSQILIEPDFNHGIILLDQEGNILKHLRTVNGKDLTLGDKAIMLADKSILFTFDNKFILKTSPPYDDIVTIKEMNYSEWGNVNSNKDGSKISVRIDKHIYLMNIDGTGLRQVTDSQTHEREGIFSPDGNFLLIAADYQPATSRPGTWSLNIVPLDGAIHSVGKNPSKSVIVVKEHGREIVEKGDNYMLWR